MGASQEIGKIATGIIENLKSQPLALALVVVNVLFLATALLILRDVATNARVRDESEARLLAQVLSDCGIKKPENRGAR